MNIFCDTSVLVAATLESHAEHEVAKEVLNRVIRGDDVGHCSAHNLAETFSVLTRMPTVPKLQPRDVLGILEKNIFPHFVLLALQPADYLEAIRSLATTQLAGGRIYDLLHLRAAARVSLDRIYTLNANEWVILAPELAPIIAAPASLSQP